MKDARYYTFSDKCCGIIDNFLRTVFSTPQATRQNPAINLPESALTAEERKQAARLMRVNHCGEVCAQALYQGQALVARQAHVRQQLKRSAEEENDHLVWCQQRLTELDSHRSYLNTLFYLSSFFLAVMVGLLGDRWSLGFLQETERQVERHLDNYLLRLPLKDQKSQVIVKKMREDEIKHGQIAVQAGAASLPRVLKKIMLQMSKIMIYTAYRI